MRHLFTQFGETLNQNEIEAFLEHFTILPNKTIKMDDLVDVLRFEPNAYLNPSKPAPV
jgi:hypothetical protein